MQPVLPWVALRKARLLKVFPVPKSALPLVQSSFDRDYLINAIQFLIPSMVLVRRVLPVSNSVDILLELKEKLNM